MSKLITRGIEERVYSAIRNPQISSFGYLIFEFYLTFPFWSNKKIIFSFFIDERLAYFVEFFGTCSISAWSLDENIFSYDGIESFKTYAQDQVDRAPTKLAKEKLAEKFQLKVATNRRDQWERAIEQANSYLRNGQIYAIYNNNNNNYNNNDTSNLMRKKKPFVEAITNKINVF